MADHGGLDSTEREKTLLLPILSSPGYSPWRFIDDSIEKYIGCNSASGSEYSIRFIFDREEGRFFERLRTICKQVSSKCKRYDCHLDSDLLDISNQVIGLQQICSSEHDREYITHFRLYQISKKRSVDVTRRSEHADSTYQTRAFGFVDETFLSSKMIYSRGPYSCKILREIAASTFNSIANVLHGLYPRGLENGSVYMECTEQSPVHSKNPITPFQDWKCLQPICPVVTKEVDTTTTNRVNGSSFMRVKQSEVTRFDVEVFEKKQNSAQLPKEKGCMDSTSVPLEDLCKTHGYQVEKILIYAVVRFMDLFSVALENPEVPLMQLDADSLAITELAAAFTRSCNQTVTVVDMFSNSTCKGLLNFITRRSMQN